MENPSTASNTTPFTPIPTNSSRSYDSRNGRSASQGGTPFTGRGWFDAANSGYLDRSCNSLSVSNSALNSQRVGIPCSDGSELFLGGSSGISNYLQSDLGGSLAQLSLGGDYASELSMQRTGSSSIDAIDSNMGDAANAGRRGHGYRMLWQQVTKVNKGEALSQTPVCGMTVEDLHRTIRNLPVNEPAAEAVRQGLQYLDSSATAALLKELHKTGVGHRAVEIFDWLRTLDASDDLSALCDVKTYTTAISQCTNHQHLRRALELVAEMKSRGIQCNVHTYSALMNVCNKCNELELALDVFNQLKKEGIQPSLVTYNTLIEIYGKRSQWQEALAVLDALYEAQISAEVRTYNQVISVCNRAGHPEEALKVYQRMVSAGVQPSATTYTSLISAYGKQGQLQCALDIFRDMVARGCERNVITYSSLISACEKVGDHQTALALFQEMHKENCTPNVVTFNSLISACANAGQWQKSCEVFDQMLQFQCRPDKITYVGLFKALQKGGQWSRVLKTYQIMISQGIKGDSVIYNLLLDTLWSSGIAKVQVRALQLWVQGVQTSSFRITKQHNREAQRIEYAVTAITPGAAVVNVLQWLADVSMKIGSDPNVLQTTLALTLSCQRARNGQAEQVSWKILEVIRTMLTAYSCPATVSSCPLGVSISVLASSVYKWMMTEFFGQCIALVVESRFKRITDEELLGENILLEAKCRDAFQLVLDYESRYKLNRSLATKEMMLQRPQMVQYALQFAQQLCFRQEVAHDALQLVDRVVCSGFSASKELLPLFVCSCVVITGIKGQNIEQIMETIFGTTGFEVDALQKMQNDIKSILGNDVATVAPTRVAHVFLERLGLSTSSSNSSQYGYTLVQGINSLLDSVASNASIMVYPPSKIAACVTCAVRSCLGYTPSWPLALAEMTGFKSMNDESIKEIFLAVQKLLKQVLDNFSASNKASTTQQSQSQQSQQQQLEQLGVSSQGLTSTSMPSASGVLEAIVGDGSLTNSANNLSAGGIVGNGLPLQPINQTYSI